MNFRMTRGTILLSMILVVAGLASCGGDEPQPAVDRGEAVSVTSPDGRVVVSGEMIQPAKCTIDYYAKDKKADVTVKLANGYAYSATEVPYKIQEGRNVIDYTDSSNSTVVKSTTGPMPTNMATTEAAEIFSLNMRSGTADVLFVPAKSICVGQTTVTSASGSFSNKEASYLVTFFSDRIATITVHNAKFAANMPAVGDMEFADLNVTYTAKGFELNSDNLIPTIGGVPYPSFAISALHFAADLNGLGSATFTFTCGAFGQSFKVNATDLCCLPVSSGR